MPTFDDGHCGVAIDGKAVFISDNASLTDQPLQVSICGQSVKTTVEVAARNAWTGICTDVDWSPLPFATAVGAARATAKH